MPDGIPAKRPKYGPSSTTQHLGKFRTNIKFENFDIRDLFLAPSDFDFNDTLIIPHYESNFHPHGGKQRRGISDMIGPVPTYQVHVERAANMHSPLSIDTPLPYDLGTALDLVAFTPDNELREFWNGGITKLRELASLTWPISREWYAQTPSEICPAVGTINVALVTALIPILEIGDPAWASQFAHGFPVTGYLSQSGVSPPNIGRSPRST